MPPQLETGLAERALPGQRRSGDRAVFAPYDGGALVAAIDGLGHGDEAAEAADKAAVVIAATPAEDPVALLARCHRALARSRGAVMTLAWFDLRRALLTWTGVGNVEGRRVRPSAGPAGRTEGALTKGGVVGYNMPSVHVSSTPLEDGDLIVLATDGIQSTFASSLPAGGSAQQIAERILDAHGRAADDALVVVVRYRPSA